MSERDRPWVFRTYSGHTSARASNALYRTNLAKGQTGLSVAFDLPTQTGFDSDHPLARGEVGKVGVPVGHIEDMELLFEQLPLDRMNTSMTINATAAWLLALYVATAERQGVDPRTLQGTTQNDIIKEYLSRGTYVFPPQPSMHLIGDMVAYAVEQIPKWNPINVCSYHLQEAGATPVQEIAYAMATAIAVLDGVRAREDLPAEALPRVVGRISFFLNSGIRFVEEICKGRAMAELWDEITRERYGVGDEKLRRFRYGVQVNSLGLTEAQPENNVIRIALEALGVTFSKKARCRALQLPAWNEALGLPRPWDQQWSLRIQQILAYETDLLEYEDLFDGSHVVEARTRALIGEARAELDEVLAQGGAVAAVENAYMKRRLVESQTARARAIEDGEHVVVGVNRFTEGEPSPLLEGARSVLRVDASAEREQIERLQAFRSRRSDADVTAALQGLKEALAKGANIMPPSIRAAHAGVTTGEWADALRARFGEYRAPTGVVAHAGNGGGERTLALRERVHALTGRLGRPLKLLVGKPGLDGHSNGAEQIAVKARDAGMEVVYEGIRLTPTEIVQSARDEGVHVIGLSILSGSHGVLVVDVLEGLRQAGLAELPVVVGGIIPDEDAAALREAGVRRVYTPKDFDLTRIVGEIVDVVAESAAVH
ncbi:MAG: protein meaA [Myxococcota bacterium]|jgi:(2R)-ethylmalonyl-CoA mutase|nr:protein meaA [Deltaproteobacteria bacterium]MCP4245369.1 protein meaA [bacterium]MDP6073421.1 protein meaA [Myxococcota bacterium]MDP7074460.1 protein meaA [Myxococcota bacterium]MDP7301428.1 protein meaA [Myxococcota bacterium]